MDTLKTIQKYNMLSNGETVLVGVSGGPDSVCLLHLLKELSSYLKLTLFAAHLNHCIRAEESDKDEAFVKNLCSDWKIPCITTKIDIPSKSKEIKRGIEETARILRYEFLNSTAKHIGAGKIAVGHNADDRAETVLMNIIRGCGIDGLASIKPINSNIIRPLIDTKRIEIDDYINLNNLPYRVDESNSDTTYSRNKIRHELIPYLKENFNPSIIDSLIRLADISTDTQDFLGFAVDNARLKTMRNNGLDLSQIKDLPQALAMSLIRQIILNNRGNLIDIDLETILNILSVEKDTVITLPGDDWFVHIKDNLLSLKPAKQNTPKIEYNYQLEIPGQVFIPQANLTISVSVLDELPTNIKPDSNTAHFDLDQINLPLTIRNFKPGDKMSLFGMSGHKKLHDIFIDEKIPNEKRGIIPILCDASQILWVPGIKRSNAAIVGENSNSVIKISISSLDY